MKPLATNVSQEIEICVFNIKTTESNQKLSLTINLSQENFLPLLNMYLQIYVVCLFSFLNIKVWHLLLFSSAKVCLACALCWQLGTHLDRSNMNLLCSSLSWLSFRKFLPECVGSKCFLLVLYRVLVNVPANMKHRFGELVKLCKHNFSCRKVSLQQLH